MLEPIARFLLFFVVIGGVALIIHLVRRSRTGNGDD